MMVTFNTLKEKFEDKGMLYEFRFFVPPPPPFDPSRLLGTMEERLSCFKNAVNKVYNPLNKNTHSFQGWGELLK